MNFIQNISLSLLLLVTFISCNDNDALPKGVLNKDTMVDVITEIEITQALIKLKFSIPDTSVADSVINKQLLYNQVYDQFSISEEQFNSSMDYYCAHPTELETIYTEVLSQLTEKQANQAK